MVDDKQEPKTPGEDGDAPKKSRKKLFLGGGILGLIGAAYLAASAAVPKAPEYKVFGGPFVAPISPSNFTTNLAGDGRRRFLLLELNVQFDSYEELYATTRTALPFYDAVMRDAVLRISSKYDESVMNEDIGSVFLEELEVALDPILFPVQLGKSLTPNDPDPKSGIRMGFSGAKGTLRGPLYDHLLTIDAGEKKLRLDDGAPVAFEGTERDLRVENERGRSVYLDVTDLKPSFKGQVMVGVHGRIRELLKKTFNLQ